MTAHQRYMQYRKNELYHFNPNHDPKDGKFTFAKGVRKIKNAANKVVRWIDGQDELDAIMAKKEAAQKASDSAGKNNSNLPATQEEADKIEMDHETKSEVYNALTNKAGFKFETKLKQYNKDVEVKDSSGNSVKHELTIDYGSVDAGTNKDKLLSDVTKIEKNLSSIDKNVRSQIASKIFEERSFPIEYERDSSGNLREKPFSVKTKEELADKLGTWDGKRTGSTIDFHPASGKYNAHAQIYYDDGGLWGGHFIVAEYNLDKNKVERYSIEG